MFSLKIEQEILLIWAYFSGRYCISITFGVCIFTSCWLLGITKIKSTSPPGFSPSTPHTIIYAQVCLKHNAYTRNKWPFTNHLTFVTFSFSIYLYLDFFFYFLENLLGKIESDWINWRPIEKWLHFKLNFGYIQKEVRIYYISLPTDKMLKVFFMWHQIPILLTYRPTTALYFILLTLFYGIS